MVAPFIKHAALVNVLSVLPRECALRVVTRWRPEEVHAGVSDLGVFDEVVQREGATLWLCDRLHAKYYRGDRAVFLGSANLTGLGMGWRGGANLELMRGLPFDAQFEEFERVLIDHSVMATTEIRDAVEVAVAALPPAAKPPRLLVPSSASSPRPELNAFWLPRSRYPSNIWLLYVGEFDRLTVAAREDAVADIDGMNIPPDLSKEAFGRYVAALLQQQPVVRDVDRFARENLRFGAVRAALKANHYVISSERDAGELLQTLTRWLTYYMPHVYELRTARFTEVLRRR